MRTINLVKDVSSSVLGFGCAPILGSVGAKMAHRAIDVAYERGVTHFDLARSYGYGEAENFVGKVMKGRRDKVVFASKFGIVANWKAQFLKPVKPLVRFIKNNKPKTMTVTIHVDDPGKDTIADRFLDRIPLSGAQMRISLEQSLRALRTDYLDYLFIHEPLTTVHEFEELFTHAEKLKAEGKIRAWGLAYMRSKEQLHHQYLNRFDVLQFDNSPGAVGYDETVARRGPLPNVIFSPLRGGSNELSPTGKLQKLFTEFPSSVILCSMFDERHIHNNADIAG